MIRNQKQRQMLPLKTMTKNKDLNHLNKLFNLQKKNQNLDQNISKQIISKIPQKTS